MDSYDVVIIGAGTAGLMAAIHSAEAGLNTVLIEQSERIGGALWYSWGHMSAAGTALQEDLGIQDSVAAHIEDIHRISKGEANRDLVELAANGAAKTFDWLMERNFDLDPQTPKILHFHEAYRTPRTYWGREAGRSILNVLEKELDRYLASGAITLMLNTRLESFREGNPGHIRSVSVSHTGEVIGEVSGRNFILATGGTAGNPGLFAQLTNGMPLTGPGSPTSNGSGIQAALTVGAKLWGEKNFYPTYGGILQEHSSFVTEHLDHYPQLVPQERNPWEIHVNIEGERFVAEDSSSVDYRELQLLEQPELTFWIIYDERISSTAPPLFPHLDAQELQAKFGTHPSFVAADSLTELAMQTGMDSAVLEETVQSYNTAVESGKDNLGRRYMPLPIIEAPFYAIKNHGTTLKSPSGVEINNRFQVRCDDGAFDNLFAIGEAIGGSTLSGRAFVSGMSVTPALTFGRIVIEEVMNSENEAK